MIFLFKRLVIQLITQKLKYILDLLYSSNYKIRLQNETISRNNDNNSENFIQDLEIPFCNQAIYPSKFLKTKSSNKTSFINLLLIKTKSLHKKKLL